MGEEREVPTPLVGARPPSVDAPTPEELVKVVALDGPAGTGKSTVCRLVAQRLGWRFVDTGATYRAVTLAVLRAHVDPEDATSAGQAARSARVELVTDPVMPTVRLDGEDVTAEIRTAEVTAAVSAVSSHPQVRAILIDLQRRAMGTQGAVVEGRDIATVVAPKAGVKVYLDARPEVRAARRSKELSADLSADLTVERHGVSQVQQALVTRDTRDNQTNALRPSQGAIHVETSDLTIEQVVDAVVQLVEEAGLR